MSDLHVGTGARARDLAPVPSPDQVEDGFRARFIDFVRREKIKVDYLICPGDASNKAQPDEFALASEFLSEAAEALGVPEDGILFVPGNHDVNWAAYSLYPNDKSGLGRKQRYVPLVETDHALSRIVRRSPHDILTDPYIARWESDHLLVLGHNSSSHDDPAVAVHHGLISDETIKALKELLPTLDLSPARLRVFLVHHHPIQYRDPSSLPTDFSVMQNAGALLDLLWKTGFDLVIHGHQHRPRFDSYAKNASLPLAVLCAGSVSARLDNRWSGIVTNQFHVVEVLGRDSHTECIYGHVDSWAYLFIDGWRRSRTEHGIDGRRAFGVYSTRKALGKRIRPLILSLKGASGYIEWSEIVNMDSELRYLPLETIVAVLDELSAPLGFRRHGDLPDEIVLLF